MTRIALYPGSFDPPTRGHEDLIARACELADRVVVAVATNPSKQPLFSVEERLRLLRAVAGEHPNVTFDTFEGLVAEYARKIGATFLVRGLRAVADFEYEFQMALMNRPLNDRLETVCLVPTSGLTFISASLVREVARFGGDVSSLVHPVVVTVLKEKFAK